MSFNCNPYGTWWRMSWDFPTASGFARCFLFFVTESAAFNSSCKVETRSLRTWNVRWHGRMNQPLCSMGTTFIWTTTPPAHCDRRRPHSRFPCALLVHPLPFPFFHPRLSRPAACVYFLSGIARLIKAVTESQQEIIIQAQGKGASSNKNPANVVTGGQRVSSPRHAQSHSRRTCSSRRLTACSPALTHMSDSLSHRTR